MRGRHWAVILVLALCVCAALVASRLWAVHIGLQSLGRAYIYARALDEGAARASEAGTAKLFFVSAPPAPGLETAPTILPCPKDLGALRRTGAGDCRLFGASSLGADEDPFYCGVYPCIFVGVGEREWRDVGVRRAFEFVRSNPAAFCGALERETDLEWRREARGAIDCTSLRMFKGSLFLAIYEEPPASDYAPPKLKFRLIRLF